MEKQAFQAYLKRYTTVYKRLGNTNITQPAEVYIASVSLCFVQQTAVS